MGCDFSFKAVARSCAYSVHEYLSDTVQLDEVLEAYSSDRVMTSRSTASIQTPQTPLAPVLVADLFTATFPPKTPGVYHRSLTQLQFEEKPCLESNFLKSQINSHRAQIQQSTRRERNKLIGRNILFLFQRLAAQDMVQDMAQAHQRLRDERNLWKDCALRAKEDFNTVLNHNKHCQQTINHLEQVQDEMSSTIEAEKTKTQMAIKCRKVAVSSLRDRMKSDKERIWTQVQCREQQLQQAKQELYEARCSRDDLIGRIECLENSLASLRCDETLQTLWDQISCALSHMSEVMPVRSVNGQSITDNMRDLKDGVRDLVKEVISRRNNNHRLNEEIFKMKEERTIWSIGYQSYEREARELKEKLGMAVRTITELRREAGGRAGSTRD